LLLVVLKELLLLLMVLLLKMKLTKIVRVMESDWGVIYLGRHDIVGYLVHLDVDTTESNGGGTSRGGAIHW
jgi:hypothetical protein